MTPSSDRPAASIAVVVAVTKVEPLEAYRLRLRFDDDPDAAPRSEVRKGVVPNGNQNIP